MGEIKPSPSGPAGWSWLPQRSRARVSRAQPSRRGPDHAAVFSPESDSGSRLVRPSKACLSRRGLKHPLPRWSATTAAKNERRSEVISRIEQCCSQKPHHLAGHQADRRPWRAATALAAQVWPRPGEQPFHLLSQLPAACCSDPGGFPPCLQGCRNLWGWPPPPAAAAPTRFPPIQAACGNSLQALLGGAHADPQMKADR